MKYNISLDSDIAKFGIGLFETIKIYKGIPILLDKHLDRMYNSINELNISFKTCKMNLKKTITNYVKDIEYKALRVTVFDDGYTFLLRDIQYQESDYTNGYKLKISPIIRGKSIIYRHKTISYIENIYSKKDAIKSGFDESLFINMDNKILEGSMSNIFFIKDDKIYTPCKDLDILAGIIRQEVIDIAKDLNIDVIEREIRIEEVHDFDFCFITNSLMDIMRVRQIENVEYSNTSELFSTIEKSFKEKYYG
ncbi:aminotransferase class IV [Alkalithermobacter paradoxus]|uniref:Branched-chain-amino-acid aminotransferase n=1 Tax=Alkalithermobacter paradoxus TaxID=29349 RepID=A0A1V4IBN9_9FIRM|nr:branched-chain-amino-acid aminotransferase [[Clostridium] thermoalcaliphilum]